MYVASEELYFSRKQGFSHGAYKLVDVFAGLLAYKVARLYLGVH